MSDVAITLDVDWAPDFAIDLTAAILTEHRVRTTWFVTHASVAIDRLRENDLFELGIHPNFLPGSTHGADEASVLAHCLALVPEAVSMRTHGLYQSTPLLSRVMHDTPIELDASLFLPGATNVAPIRYAYGGGSLLRVPYVWEDDVAMENGEWDVDAVLARPGLTVLDFHPVHVALNSTSMGSYRALLERGPLQEAREDEAPVTDGRGTRTFLESLADRLADGGVQLRELL
jgi:hypothetical protein